MIDRIDTAILQHLQREGRLTNRELAEKISLSNAPCWRRVKRLEDEGYIDGYTALVNPQLVDLRVIAFAQVSLDNHHPETIAAFDREIQRWSEVLECHSVTGPSCDYLLKVIVSDMEAYEQFLSAKLLLVPGLRSVSTLFSLKRRKQTTALPIKEFSN